MEKQTKPVFNTRIFWDVVFENIDYDAKAKFVMSGYLSEVMWMTSGIAGGTMVMRKSLRYCLMLNFYP